MKKAFALLLVLLLCLGLAAGCGTPAPSGDPGGPTGNSQTSEGDVIKNESDFAQRIPNYSCEIHVKHADSETNVIRYKVHPDGIAFQTDMSGGVSMIHDFKNSKTYILDESDKTAMAMDAPDMSASFAHPATYFMAWGETDFSALQKGSSAQVDGRSATAYSYKLGASEIKYYIDKEMGFCLAYEIINDGTLVTRWEMKNFKVGGVTVADISVPEGYTISDLTD